MLGCGDRSSWVLVVWKRIFLKSRAGHWIDRVGSFILSDYALIAAMADRHVRNLWSCEACGYQFETSVYFPVPNETRGQARPSDVAPVH